MDVQAGGVADVATGTGDLAFGFVNKGSFDFNTSRVNDNWGFGMRFFLMGSPLRLDYAFPLTTDGRNDEGNQFNFSFGTKF